jgi:hypothetical protein
MSEENKEFYKPTVRRPLYSPSERDWPEDFHHENGQYMNKCCHCKKVFCGNKHRVSCKKCFNNVA